MGHFRDEEMRSPTLEDFEKFVGQLCGNRPRIAGLSYQQIRLPLLGEVQRWYLARKRLSQPYRKKLDRMGIDPSNNWDPEQVM